jgi:hypothetical protein
MPVIASSAVDLARIQFATTSIYHFLFVPLSLGLGPIVAAFQTRNPLLFSRHDVRVAPPPHTFPDERLCCQTNTRRRPVTGRSSYTCLAPDVEWVTPKRTLIGIPLLTIGGAR